MRSSRLRNHDSHCFRCYMRRESCICPILPTVPTQTKFLILRHIGEAERSSNTGRLVALAMPNAQILSCGGGDRLGLPSLDHELLQSPGTWLLWPDGTSSSMDMLDEMPPQQLVVLDATWRQARRLYNRTPILQTMPRLALPAPAQNRNRLREQHRSDGMSTIEVVAAAVARVEGAEIAEPLEKLFDEVVRRTFNRRWGIKQL